MRKRLLLILGIVIMAGGVSRATIPLGADSQTRLLWNMDSTVTEDVTYLNVVTGLNQTLSYSVVRDGQGAHDLNLGNKVGSGFSSQISLYTPAVLAGLSGNALSFVRQSSSQGDVAFNMGTWNGAIDTALTLDMYFKPTTLDSTDQTLAYVGPAELRVRSNKLYWYGFAFSGTTNYVATTSTLTSGTWYHAIGTNDGTNITLKLYTVNTSTLVETQVGSTLTTGVVGMKLSGSGYNPDMTVGAGNAYGSSRPFVGLIDDVRLDVVPEPVSMLLLGVGGILALRNRKK